MSNIFQDIKNTKVTYTFRPRKGSFDKYGRLIMLQHTLNKLSLKGSKSKEVGLIRDIVLGIHSVAENWIDHLIGAYYLDTARGKIFRSFCEIILSKITFYEKIMIIKGTGFFENKEIEMLKSINTIRNAFVHFYSIRSNKFNYKGKKITQWGHIEVLVKDFDSFLSKISGKKINFLSEVE